MKEKATIFDYARIGDNYSSVLSCPNCRKPIVNVWNIAKYEPNYCHYCGQALDWSGAE